MFGGPSAPWLGGGAKCGHFVVGVLLTDIYLILNVQKKNLACADTLCSFVSSPPVFRDCFPLRHLIKILSLCSQKSNSLCRKSLRQDFRCSMEPNWRWTSPSAAPPPPTVGHSPTLHTRMGQPSSEPGGTRRPKRRACGVLWLSLRWRQGAMEREAIEFVDMLAEEVGQVGRRVGAGERGGKGRPEKPRKPWRMKRRPPVSMAITTSLQRSASTSSTLFLFTGSGQATPFITNAWTCALPRCFQSNARHI